MFTQCPDCQTTFRVSAAVLQQADGRVRCGGCSNAFNALEHLLNDDGSAATSADSTSDQNKQLLETLEKLAGPEVLIEDTGVEWRVLEQPEGGDESDPDATGSLRFVLEGDDENEKPAMLSRQDDVPRPVSDTQESLDLPETDPPKQGPGERRYDDDTILPDDFGEEDDLDELPFLQKPEAPKRRAGDRDAIQETPEFDDAQVDLALGDPDEWEELLDEVANEDESEVSIEASAEQDDSAADVENPVAEEPPEEDMPSDIDTQFLLQAEEMGLDTGSHQIIEEDDDEDIDAFLASASEEVEEDDLDETDIGDPDAEIDDEEKEDLSIEEARPPEEDADDRGEEADEKTDQPDLESTGEFEAKIAEAEKALAGEEDEDAADDKEADEPVELELEGAQADSSSADDEDAFASAIRGGKDVSKLFDEGSHLVETIIMEGDVVGDAIEAQREQAAQASGTFENPGPLEDTYSLSRGKLRGGRRASDPASYTVMASVVVLILLLIGQIVHQSRQTLATYGAFNHTIGSIYRVMGKPVTPEWDVRGWQFEATSNSVDEEADLLTIYSRIANKSGQPLPYPLVHISLTDRWEDIIGSRVLEPNEYLAGDLDPRKPVPTGENFTAVITIESPSAEATGFKLTVCYRVRQGRVRCATQDFKN